MKVHETPLNSPAEIETLAKTLSSEEMIAFDTEFIRENTFYPQWELLQIATDRESWLVDIQALRGKERSFPDPVLRENLSPLMKVFQDPKSLKLAHAAQADQECFYTSIQQLVYPILDTATAASLCGRGENMGLKALLEDFVNVEIKKGHSRTNWATRPLSAHLLEYAHQDVIHLVAAAKVILEDLEGRGRRKWAIELSSKSADPKNYELNVESVFKHLARGSRVDKKGLPVLWELIQWREERMRELNIPKRWLADDGVLIDLSRTRPKDIEHLYSFRGLSKGEVKKSGEKILSLIRKGVDTPLEELPAVSKKEPPSRKDAAALELLKCFMNDLAASRQLSPKHLVNPMMHLAILRSGVETPEELVEQNLITQGASEMIGKDLVNFLKGRIGLRLNGRKIKIFKLKGNGGEDE
jgi:ribonuclease D